MLNLIKNKIFSVIFIFLISFCIRIAYIAEVKGNLITNDLVLDSYTNNAVADYIFENGEYPDEAYMKAPGYYYFLAGMYKIFGKDNFLSVRIIQVFLSSLSCVFLFLIAKKRFGADVGIITGLAASFLWTGVYFSNELLDTTLTIFMYSLFLWIFLNWKSNSYFKWIISGLVISIGIVIRPMFFLYVILIVVWLLYLIIKHRSYKRLKSLLLFIAASITFLIPVIWHNYAKTGGFIFIAGGYGINFNQGNSEVSNGKDPVYYTNVSSNDWIFDQDIDLSNPRFLDNIGRDSFLTVKNETGISPTIKEISAFYLSKAWDYIFENPWEITKLYVKKLFYFFSSYEYPNNRDLEFIRQYESKTLYIFSFISTGILLPFIIVGIIASWKIRKRSAPLFYFVFIGFGLTMLAYICARYRLLIIFFAIPFAVYGAKYIIKSFIVLIKKRKIKKEPIILFIVLIAMFIISYTDFFNYHFSPPNITQTMITKYEKSDNINNIDFLQEIIDQQQNSLTKNQVFYYIFKSQSAWIDYIKGDYMNASRKCIEILIDQKALPKVYTILADIYEKAGNSTELGKILIEAKQSFPLDIHILYRYGRFFNDKGALNQALFLFNRSYLLGYGSISYMRDFAYTYYYLSKLEYNVDYQANAIKYFNMAQQIKYDENIQTLLDTLN